MNNSNQQNTVENLGRRGFVVSGAAALFAGLVGPQILGCRNSVAQNFEEPAANSPKKGAEAAKSGFEALSEEEVKALCSEDLVVRKFSKKGNARFGTIDGEKINRRAVKAQEVMGEDFWRYRKDDGDYLAHVPDSLEKGEALRFERVLKMNIKFDDDGGFKPVGIVDFAGHRLRRKKHYKTEWIQKNDKNYFTLIIKDQTFICPVAFEDLDKKDQEISLIHDYQIPSETPEKSAKIQEIEARFAEMKKLDVPKNLSLTIDNSKYRITSAETLEEFKRIIGKHLNIDPNELEVQYSIDHVKPKGWLNKRTGKRRLSRDQKDKMRMYPVSIKYRGNVVATYVNWQDELRIFALGKKDGLITNPVATIDFSPSEGNHLENQQTMRYVAQTSYGERSIHTLHLEGGRRMECIRKNDSSQVHFLAYYNQDGELYKLSEFLDEETAIEVEISGLVKNYGLMRPMYQEVTNLNDARYKDVWHEALPDNGESDGRGEPRSKSRFDELIEAEKVLWYAKNLDK